MEDIEEASLDPTISVVRKSSAEKTQLMNATASFEFEDFDSVDFKEHSGDKDRSTIIKSKGRVEEY